MANNQNPNGRNGSLPDENRPSWRPQDQELRGRDDERGWDRDRGDRDDERYERGRSGGGSLRESRFGGGRGWQDDEDRSRRHEWVSSTDAYGQGQSGYGAGRYGEDRSLGYQSRNQGYLREDQERQSPGMGIDERFGGGRGGTGYWEDRRDRDEGMGRGFEDRPWGGGRGEERMGSQGYGGYQGSQYRRETGYGSERGPTGDGGGYQGFRGGSGGAQFTGGSPGQQYGGSGYYGHGHQGQMGAQNDGETHGYGGQGPQGYQAGYGQPGGPQGMPGYGQSTYGYGQQGFGQGRSGGYAQGGMGQVSHRGKGPLGYTRSDERIREQVCELLSDDDHVDASNIEVTVKNGDVVLAGTVPDRHMKRLAEDLVERCAGVKDVQNQLRVSTETRSGGNQPTGSTVGKGEAEMQAGDKKHRA